MNRRDFAKLPMLSAVVASAKVPIAAQGVVWIPPTLCACRLVIDADWTPGSITSKGTAYRFPIPFTIRRIDIASVCAAHAFAAREALPEFPYGEEYHQEGGYIRLTTQPAKVWRSDVGEIVEGPPLLGPAKATAAERLFIHMFRYGGTVWRPDTCRCTLYHWFERGKDPVGAEHPLHTERCVRHKHLSPADHYATVLAENQRKNMEPRT